jgi:hypothetical protein
MHAILIWFDHLPYGVPGCCGNTQAHTPGFDRFAAGSVTFDNCFVDDRRGEGAGRLVDVLQTIYAAGVAVRVLSVHPTQLVSLLNRRADTDERRGVAVETLEDDNQLSERLVRALAAASTASGSADRETLRAVTVISLPGVITSEGKVIDESLQSADRLLDRLALAHAGEQTLLLVTAGAAHLTAEQRHELDERMIHVPLLGRCGLPLEFGVHSPSLVASSDVLHALVRWAGLWIEWAERDAATHAEALLRELSGARVASRQSLLLRGPDAAVGVRTREWYLTTRLETVGVGDAAASAVDQAALYVKPDDLWDRLDVASQSPGVVEELAGMLSAAEGKSGESR